MSDTDRKMPLIFFIKNYLQQLIGWIFNRDVVWVKFCHDDKIHICFIISDWDPFVETKTQHIVVKRQRYKIDKNGKVLGYNHPYKGFFQGRWIYADYAKRVMMNLRGEADF